MIYSLVICTIVYILLTLVLTGAVNYRNFDGVGDPLAFIFEKQNLNVGWMQFFVAIAAVVAMTSVLLVFQMGQPRIWMSMSRDGLMPPVFQKIHKKFKTPSFATIVTGLVVGVPILFTDKTFVLDFTSIATLFAFVLVCGGVLLITGKRKNSRQVSSSLYQRPVYFSIDRCCGQLLLLPSLSKTYFADMFNFDFSNNADYTEWENQFYGYGNSQYFIDYFLDKCVVACCIFIYQKIFIDTNDGADHLYVPAYWYDKK